MKYNIEAVFLVAILNVLCCSAQVFTSPTSGNRLNPILTKIAEQEVKLSTFIAEFNADSGNIDELKLRIASTENELRILRKTVEDAIRDSRDNFDSTLREKFQELERERRLASDVSELIINEEFERAQEKFMLLKNDGKIEEIVDDVCKAPFTSAVPNKRLRTLRLTLYDTTNTGKLLKFGNPLQDVEKKFLVYRHLGERLKNNFTDYLGHIGLAVVIKEEVIDQTTSPLTKSNAIDLYERLQTLSLRYFTSRKPASYRTSLFSYNKDFTNGCIEQLTHNLYGYPRNISYVNEFLQIADIHQMKTFYNTFFGLMKKNNEMESEKMTIIAKKLRISVRSRMFALLTEEEKEAWGPIIDNVPLSLKNALFPSGPVCIFDYSGDLMQYEELETDVHEARNVYVGIKPSLDTMLFKWSFIPSTEVGFKITIGGRHLDLKELEFKVKWPIVRFYYGFGNWLLIPVGDYVYLQAGNNRLMATESDNPKRVIMTASDSFVGNMAKWKISSCESARVIFA